CGLLLNPEKPWIEEFPRELKDVGDMSWTTRRRLRELDADGATAYVMTSPFERTAPVDSAVPSYVVESGIPIVAVLYDLIPEIVDVYPPELMPLYRARREFVKQADLLLTLSEHVRRDAIERLGVSPERVAVIGAASSDFFRPALPGERPRDVLAQHVGRISRPFALSVTGWLAHKNVEGLINAWSRLPRGLRREYQLVLTCPLPPGAEQVWNELAIGSGLAPDDVVVTGHVDDRAVRALYQQAQLLVLPSYEEGFGLPVLEAARCGCAAITSSTSSAPEVLEWEPSTFAPQDTDAMAETIERGMLDPVFRADLRAVGDAAARRHTWDRVGERAARACASMPKPRRRREAAPYRVALVGPLTAPDVPSGIATDRVATLLRPLCDVHRFDSVASPHAHASADAAKAPGVRSYSAHALGDVRDAWGYDVIVYMVDRRPTMELRELARAHSGVVWFVEAPDDRAVGAELAGGATLVVRVPDVPVMAIDPGPFHRAAPVTDAPDDWSTDGRVLMDVLRLPARPVGKLMR
ncbi:MAG TPA: glycosyltransferase family 1 protein, partial [Acidimicrobiia bacterium]|nr:glycosyltransferase family 1 protein [Acidimicrobiia bacterium]